MNGRRSNIEIIADILRMGQASKTQIMYRVSMSYAQLQKYLDYLIVRGFLNRTMDGYRNGTYHITPHGKSLLQSIEKIEEALNFGNGYEANENISLAIVASKSRNEDVHQPARPSHGIR